MRVRRSRVKFYLDFHKYKSQVCRRSDGWCLLIRCYRHIRVNATSNNKYVWIAHTTQDSRHSHDFHTFLMPCLTVWAPLYNHYAVAHNQNHVSHFFFYLFFRISRFLSVLATDTCAGDVVDRRVCCVHSVSTVNGYICIKEIILLKYDIARSKNLRVQWMFAERSIQSSYIPNTSLPYSVRLLCRLCLHIS